MDKSDLCSNQYFSSHNYISKWYYVLHTMFPNSIGSVVTMNKSTEGQNTMDPK